MMTPASTSVILFWSVLDLIGKFIYVIAHIPQVLMGSCQDGDWSRYGGRWAPRPPPQCRAPGRWWCLLSGTGRHSSEIKMTVQLHNLVLKDKTLIFRRTKNVKQTKQMARIIKAKEISDIIFKETFQSNLLTDRIV